MNNTALTPMSIQPLDTLIIIGCIVLCALYFVQFNMCSRRHILLRTSDSNYNQFCKINNPGAWFHFLVVTFLLPYGISAISVLAAFLDNKANSAIWAAPTWGLANVVFVLMITLLISYLYDRPTIEWTSTLTASLVLDIISYLVFVLVFKDPTKWEGKAFLHSWHIVPLGAVGFSSFVTSFLVIYYTRSFDKYSNLPPDKRIFSTKEVKLEKENNDNVKQERMTG